jgi:adenine phosphoribosyltransferase
VIGALIRLEIDPTALRRGHKVVVADDLIATGGTALTSAHLLREAGAVIEHALFAIDLPDLGGADRLREADITVRALTEFEGD